MLKFNVDIDLGMSGFNFHVQAETEAEAIEFAYRELECRGITNDEIETIRLTEM